MEDTHRPEFQFRRGVARNWEKPRESLLQNPKSLAELAARVVDSEPLPECVYWTTEQVEEWVASDLQLPQYKAIKTGIRALFNVPMPRYARDLTMPSTYSTAYDCATLYYYHISHQSPDLATPRSVYWRRVGLLHTTSQPEYSCHWHTISADTEGNKVRIGRYRKKIPQHYWVPMIKEGNFVPTQKKLEYFFMDTLRW